MSCVIGPPESLHRLRVVPREVAADGLPRIATVGDFQTRCDVVYSTFGSA
jgi:hypothetical protein